MAKVRVKSSACKGCLLCVAVCPRGVLVPSGKLNAYGIAGVLVRSPRSCTGCAQCVVICPENCIVLEGGT